jgi:hypothetical protein
MEDIQLHILLCLDFKDLIIMNQVNKLNHYLLHNPFFWSHYSNGYIFNDHDYFKMFYYTKETNKLEQFINQNNNHVIHFQIDANCSQQFKEIIPKFIFSKIDQMHKVIVKIYHDFIKYELDIQDHISLVKFIKNQDVNFFIYSFLKNKTPYQKVMYKQFNLQIY